jgi:hypothetical protein
MEYVIARNITRRVWTMSEAFRVPCNGRLDIYRLRDEDNTMRVMLRFEAPNWECAHHVYRWAIRNLRRAIGEHLGWPRVKLMSGVKPEHEQRRDV